MNEETISVLEFFSGIGGMHFALSKAGVLCNIVGAFDINTSANDVYRHNFGGVKVLSRNIQGMKTSDLDKLGADLWTMSPPCQPFTRLGKRKDLGDNRTGALQQIVTIFSEMKSPPKMVLLENVKGFENSDARNLFVAALKKRNFKIEEYLLSPLQFGIPNSRLRYYLLAWRSKDNSSTDMEASRELPDSDLLTEIPNTYNPGRAPGGQRVSDYLETEGDEEYFHSFLVEDKVLTRQGGVLDIVTPQSTQCCCFTRAYTQYAEGTGSVLYSGDSNLANVLSMLNAWPTYFVHMDTLADSFARWEKAKDDAEKLNCLQPLNLRYFTPREVAKFMGFPESFDMPDTVSRKNMYRLLGNSINVTVVSAVLEELLKKNV